MSQEWIGRAIVPLVIGVAFGLFKKYFPAKPNPALTRYDLPEGKRLPTGVFPLITILMGASIAVGGYFILLKTNRLFANLDGPASLRLFPPSVFWMFLPGFAALAVPWPLTLFLLRKVGYGTEVDYILDEANQKSGFDCQRVMVGMNLFLVLPLVLFTLAALPMRMTLGPDEVRVTHYARLSPETFPYKAATRAFSVDGYRIRDGSFERQRDLIIDFSGGRRLSANAIGDGDTEPTDNEVSIFLTKTGLDTQHVHAKDDLPPVSQ
jgi:hypothetical protein